VPVTVPFRELGLNAEDYTPEERASMDGQVAASTTYPKWLKSQPASVQETVLGKERARLFREGKVSSDELYRDDGSYRSLDELKKRAQTLIA
jgi:hypothetical protein